MRVRIDVERNRLQTDETAVRGSHRWEALAVALLVRNAGQAVTRAALQSGMQRLGQRTALDRTGIKRLLGGVQRMLESLLGEGAFNRLVRFEPRHLTVGPWTLAVDAAIDWEVVDDRPRLADAATESSVARFETLAAVNGRTCPSPTLSTIDPEGTTGAFAPVELLFKADAMFVSGQLQEASNLLNTAAGSRWITQEGWCVIQLRLARLLKRRGQYDEAEDHVAEVMRVCTRAGFADPGMAAMARHLLRRIRYDRRPVDFEALGADPIFNESSTLPDLRALAEAENLEALLMRRRAGLAQAAGQLRAARTMLLTAHQRMGSAMYWAASARDHENGQNFAFNIGLVNTSLHDLGDDQAAVAAFRAYRLGLQLREDFFVGRDSIWDHICIGKLWLGLPDRRAEFESDLAFELPKLSEPRFYLEAIEQARELGEMRQLALCCVNLWRFAREGQEGRQQEALVHCARKQIVDLLRLHPELQETLLDDAPDAVADMLPATATIAVPPTSATQTT